MRHRRVWRSPVLRLLLSQLYGFWWTAVWLIPMTGLLLMTSVPEWLLRAMAHAAWMSGGFAAGHCAGFHARRQGIGNGLLAGAGMCIALLLACMRLKGTLTETVMLRCLLLLGASVCGGVAGVNRKLRKAPY